MKDARQRMCNLHVVVKPLEKKEIAILQRAFSFGIPEKHIDRWQRQENGEVLYLIAWSGEEPVGHGLLKWGGATEKHIADYFAGQCPDVEDLFVLESMRSKGIGTHILKEAEYQVRERGYKQIGLSVGVGNIRANHLYSYLGYQKTPFGEHYERGEYMDSQGQLHTWEEKCVYLIKQLVE